MGSRCAPHHQPNLRAHDVRRHPPATRPNRLRRSPRPTAIPTRPPITTNAQRPSTFATSPMRSAMLGSSFAYRRLPSYLRFFFRGIVGGNWRLVHYCSCRRDNDLSRASTASPTATTTSRLVHHWRGVFVAVGGKVAREAIVLVPSWASIPVTANISMLMLLAVTTVLEGVRVPVLAGASALYILKLLVRALCWMPMASPPPTSAVLIITRAARVVGFLVDAPSRVIVGVSVRSRRDNDGWVCHHVRARPRMAMVALPPARSVVLIADGAVVCLVLAVPLVVAPVAGAFVRWRNYRGRGRWWWRLEVDAGLGLAA